MRTTVKVAWFSHHPMTEDQVKSLEEYLSPDHCKVEVVQINMTFPASSEEAVEEIKKVMMRDSSENIIAGVFPAHVAGALARARIYNRNSHAYAGYYYLSEGDRPQTLPWRVVVPVTKRVPTEDAHELMHGLDEVHSHWESL